jgi:hypothetical protein
MKRLLQTLVTTLALFVWGMPSQAQVGPVVRSVARELTEAILMRGGREAAEELAHIGGEVAVREVLEKAAREGGEALVGRVAHYGRTGGFAALKAIERSPGRWVSVLDDLGAEMAGPALRAAAREPEVLTKLATTFGKEAVEVAVKHPGVGTKLATTMGRDGIELGMKLGTDDAIRLARHADEIARLEPLARSQVLTKLGRNSRGVLDFLEAHPRILLTAAGVAAVLAVKDNFLGQTGERRVLPDGTVIEPATGFGERLIDRIIDRFHEPMTWLLGVLGLIVLGWGLIQLWHLWRVKQLKQAAATLKAKASATP